MEQHVVQEHRSDEQGRPAGGTTQGLGIDIRWQDGPLGRGDDRAAPNGAFVEGVIEAAIGRLEYYQDGQFNCTENALALEHLWAARHALESRTARRESEGTEGTHEGT